MEQPSLLRKSKDHFGFYTIMHYPHMFNHPTKLGDHFSISPIEIKSKASIRNRNKSINSQNNKTSMEKDTNSKTETTLVERKDYSIGKSCDVSNITGKNTENVKLMDIDRSIVLNNENNSHMRQDESVMIDLIHEKDKVILKLNQRISELENQVKEIERFVGKSKENQISFQINESKPETRLTTEASTKTSKIIIPIPAMSKPSRPTSIPKKKHNVSNTNNISFTELRKQLYEKSKEKEKKDKNTEIVIQTKTTVNHPKLQTLPNEKKRRSVAAGHKLDLDWFKPLGIINKNIASNIQYLYNKKRSGVMKGKTKNKSQVMSKKLLSVSKEGNESNCHSGYQNTEVEEFSQLNKDREIGSNSCNNNYNYNYNYNCISSTTQNSPKLPRKNIMINEIKITDGTSEYSSPKSLMKNNSRLLTEELSIIQTRTRDLIIKLEERNRSLQTRLSNHLN